MRILVVCQYFYPEQFRINDICQSFCDADNDVTVLTGIPNYPSGHIPKEYRFFKKRRETVHGVHIRRLPIISRKKGTAGIFFNYLSFTLVSSVYALFCDKNYDVIYVYQLSPVTMALPALIIGKRSGKNVFLYCLDIWPESLAAKGFGKESMLYRILFRMSRFIYRHVTKIAVSSQSFKKYFKEMFSIDPKEIVYLPQYAEDVYQRHHSHDIPKNTVDLVFAGNIGEMQAVETILYAAGLTKDIETLKWHIVGDGSAREKCEKLSARLGLQNIVIFEGFHRVDEMPAYYDMADAMIITLSDNEFISYTLPGKLQSYMAAGKPVIGALNGEARKVIEQSGCGLCCGACDCMSLSQLVRKFIRHPEDHRTYGENSLNYYKKYFNKDTFVRKTLGILKSLSEAK